MISSTRLFCCQLLLVRDLTRTLMLSLAAHPDIFRLRGNALSDFSMEAQVIKDFWY